MHRCYAEPARWRAPQIALSLDESRHVAQVLRLRPGDPVEVFDGCGREAPAEIQAPPSGDGRRASKGRIETAVRLTGPIRRVERDLEVTLLQALPKGTRFDWIVEKATELGVARLVPVVTSRVIARVTPSEETARAERWRRIALNAAKQCGTAWIPRVDEVSPFAAALAAAAGLDAFLIGSLQPDTRPFREVAAAVRSTRPRTVALLIGPEGDLSEGEIAEARRLGGIPVSFGPQVLRVETAALFGISVLMYEFRADPAVPPHPASPAA